MNRRSWLKSFLIALASPSQAAVARTQPVTRLDDVLEPLRAKHGLPALAGAVVSKGQIVGAAAVGARLLNSDKKVTVNDRFHLGSDTKAMTATLAGMAVEAGKLRWDATIGDALGAKVPGIEPRLAAVTLEQLLSHSGGIPSDTDEILNLYFSPDAFKYDLPTQRLRILNAWKNHAPATKPGAEFHYANLGYVIAGAMIETAFGVSWEELIDNRIFTPLRLSTAGLGPQATTGKYDAPIGYQIGDDGAVTPMPWGPAADVPPGVGPAGAAHMSVIDFATWAGWNAGGGRRGPALVKPETLDRLHRAHVNTGKLPNPRPGTPDEGDYALGWGLAKFDWTRSPVLTHNGSNGMNFAKILVDRDRDLGVVVLTNYPEKQAEAAAAEAIETLYRRFSS